MVKVLMFDHVISAPYDRLIAYSPEDSDLFTVG